MHDRPIPGLFIIGKIMRLKAFFKSFALSAFAVAFVSCSDDDEGFSYTTGEMNSPLADTIVVNDNAVMELQTDLDPSDKLVVKSNDTGAEIYLDWGYAYEGMDEDGNMLADKTRSYAKVVFDDKWECGKWKVYAENGSQRRELGEVAFVVVKTDEAKPLNSEEAYLGILSVAADGFEAGGVDFFDYYNNELGTVVYSVASALSGDNPDYAYSSINFPLDSLTTGSYTLSVRRWNYGFSQELGQFDYFKISLVDTTDIVKDETGLYYIDFHLDEIKEGDRITVAYGTGKNANYTETLAPEVTLKNGETVQTYDQVAQVYRTYIPDRELLGSTNKVYPGSDYSMSLTRNGRSIKLSGSKHLPEDTEAVE